jgi:predicted RNA-binding Zn-ribbon protein involved in translation (DUF1610 family)
VIERLRNQYCNAQAKLGRDVRAPLCHSCKTKTLPTERARVYECPKCHEQWHIKPTPAECRKLAEILKASNEKAEL